MKNRWIKSIFSGAVLLLLVFNNTFAQVPDGVISSLKTGNASALSEYFNQNIELVVLDKDDVYSKDQAKQLVQSFFNNNTAQRFNIIHQGGKDGAHYAIGNLTTNKGIFRVYFLIKVNGKESYIHQLRIEKQ